MSIILRDRVAKDIAFHLIFGAILLFYGTTGIAEASRLQSIPGASCVLFSPRSVSHFHISDGDFYCADSSPSGLCSLNCPIIFYSNFHELERVDLDYELSSGTVKAKVCGRNWDNTLMRCTESQSQSGKKGVISFSDFSMFGDLDIYSRFWIQVWVPDFGTIMQYDIVWKD